MSVGRRFAVGGRACPEGANVVSLALAVSLAVGGCATPTTDRDRSDEAPATATASAHGLASVLSDVEIHAKVNELWLRADVDLYQRINLTVDDGRVLLTGRASTPEQRVEAVRLVWQADGVTEVINDITIDNQSTVIDSARDTWIATQLRTALLFDRAIHSNNYSIDVVNGVVYLMGVAQDRDELDGVIGHAKGLARVQGVVSHVRVL